jgi:DNA-directed RNA polymerase subunit RPC12/RpoP
MTEVICLKCKKVIIDWWEEITCPKCGTKHKIAFTIEEVK